VRSPIRHLLRESHKRIRNVEVGYDGWPCVGAGLERAYKRGRRALYEARDRPGPEAFHEWRKQVKHSRYALQTLTSVAGNDRRSPTRLTETSAANRDSLQEATGAALLALIEGYQSELREKALSLGLRLYVERPEVFAECVAHYCAEWVHENASEL
jgi:hypothetical protein